MEPIPGELPLPGATVVPSATLSSSSVFESTLGASGVGLSVAEIKVEEDVDVDPLLVELEPSEVLLVALVQTSLVGKDMSASRAVFSSWTTTSSVSKEEVEGGGEAETSISPSISLGVISPKVLGAETEEAEIEKYVASDASAVVRSPSQPGGMVSPS